MSTLFEITDEFRRLYEMATSDEEREEQVFKDTLESLKAELDVKSAGCVAVMNKLEMEMQKADEIAKRYAAIAKSRKNHLGWMKEMVLSAMSELDLKEMPAGDFTIKVKKNGGVQPLKITGTVPDNMTKVTIEPDNDKIRAFLKDKDGKCEWAYLEERGSHIEVK